MAGDVVNYAPDLLLVFELHVDGKGGVIGHFLDLRWLFLINHKIDIQKLVATQENTY